MTLVNISMKLTDGTDGTDEIVINKLFNCAENNGYINHNLNSETIIDFGSKMIKLYNPETPEKATKIDTILTDNRSVPHPIFKKLFKNSEELSRNYKTILTEGLNEKKNPPSVDKAINFFKGLLYGRKISAGSVLTGNNSATIKERLLEIVDDDDTRLAEGESFVDVITRMRNMDLSAINEALREKGNKVLIICGGALENMLTEKDNGDNEVKLPASESFTMAFPPGNTSFIKDVMEDSTKCGIATVKRNVRGKAIFGKNTLHVNYFKALQYLATKQKNELEPKITSEHNVIIVGTAGSNPNISLLKVDPTKSPNSTLTITSGNFYNFGKEILPKLDVLDNDNEENPKPYKFDIEKFLNNGKQPIDTVVNEGTSLGKSAGQRGGARKSRRSRSKRRNSRKRRSVKGKKNNNVNNNSNNKLSNKKAKKTKRKSSKRVRSRSRSMKKKKNNNNKNNNNNNNK